MQKSEHIVVCHLGHMAYQPAWDLQKQLQQRLVANKRSASPQPIPHVMLLLEHPPVFTLGKSGDAAHLLANSDDLTRRGASFVHIDRGGDITFHGPGQVVAYPILDLDRFYTDIHRYLRELEEVIIRTCDSFGVQAGRLDDRTGVWTTEPAGQERKLCAMGIRCSRWVTMHGFALNVTTDLDYFSMIVPCGIPDRGVTSLSREVGQPVSLVDVEQSIASQFATVFKVTLEHLTGSDAQSFLHAYLEESVEAK